jgi:stalled ribosome rescue protein Dom34
VERGSIQIAGTHRASNDVADVTPERVTRRPTMSRYVAMWIDHKQARIFHVHADKVEAATVTAPLRNLHRKHPKGPEGAKEHPDDAERFFHAVAQSLEGNSRIFIVGPSTAKLEFLKYVHKHHLVLEPRIAGVETVDHPTDGQVLAYAKKHFKPNDRLD